MIEWIKNEIQLKQVQEKKEDFWMLMFYADFSTTAKRALTELDNFSKENKEDYILLTGDDLLAKYTAVDKIPE